MTAADRDRWDKRYAAAERPVESRLPSVFAGHAKLVATAPTALELACGAGRASVWLAMQGVAVTGYDVSPVAVEQASALALHHGVSSTCRFEVADLDGGLPDGVPVGLVMCHLFRDARLDQALIERLVPGGLLAMAALSEVGAVPGRFRVKSGELTGAFSSLEIIDGAEADGVAWLLARKP